MQTIKNIFKSFCAPFHHQKSTRCISPLLSQTAIINDTTEQDQLVSSESPNVSSESPNVSSESPNVSSESPNADVKENVHDVTQENVKKFIGDEAENVKETVGDDSLNVKENFGDNSKKFNEIGDEPENVKKTSGDNSENVIKIVNEIVGDESENVKENFRDDEQNDLGEELYFEPDVVKGKENKHRIDLEPLSIQKMIIEKGYWEPENATESECIVKADRGENGQLS